MFKPIGSLINTFPLGARSSKVLSALLVRQAAQRAILKTCEDLGEDMLRLIKVSTFKNNTLTLVCPPLIASELQMRSEGLKAGINEAIGRKVVERLRFKAG